MSSSYEEVFDEFTDRELVSLLKEQDYENVEIIKSGVIKFRHDSMIYIIDNSYDDGSIDVFMIFDDIDMSFKEMNRWNAEKRFVSVYKCDGKVCLKMSLESGITEAYLIESIKRFIALQTVFSLRELAHVASLLKMFK
ncbi:hypothetical protein CFY87_02220 [Actinobacillus seminis]|uniref:YbjN domain-containing protein n=1 Tax=Actinobacillus seminis TaxID=722 RepID=A0A263HDC2_9PAST|nr:hypothetical protein [Actinobacillus seminis]OZN25443.1 hypothetical protein CFY87_02220 [Actinobacillus seminis]SUU38058.1 Uncharacterised protein [Actinobacillus seminis]